MAMRCISILPSRFRMSFNFSSTVTGSTFFGCSWVFIVFSLADNFDRSLSELSPRCDDFHEPSGLAFDPLTQFHECPETLERRLNVLLGLRTVNRSLADFGKA